MRKPPTTPEGLEEVLRRVAGLASVTATSPAERQAWLVRARDCEAWLRQVGYGAYVPAHVWRYLRGDAAVGIESDPWVRLAELHDVESWLLDSGASL